MNEGEFGLVTSIFNLGGLVGSLLSPRVADSKGRRWTLLFNTLFLFLGPIIMGFSSSYGALVLGRVISGIGSGVVSSETIESIMKRLMYSTVFNLEFIFK